LAYAKGANYYAVVGFWRDGQSGTGELQRRKGRHYRGDKALAIELAKRKITVNCIAPGLIDTGMIEMEEAALNEAMAMIPMKRMGQAAEVAGLASYLMSDIAGYVTRQVISINGGML
jgi:enoyl-[acyl-carrier-protein] reductase (NADH)